jgi:ribosome-associated translation inhibitor RaiA
LTGAPASDHARTGNHHEPVAKIVEESAMNLRMFVRGLPDPEAVRAQARRKTESALQRFEARIRSASVRIEDETGPRRHGVDKICTIALVLDSGELRIRETGREWVQVFETALDRVRAALSRKVARSKRGIGGG